MKKLEMIAFLLLIIGGINWGFYSVTNYNLIELIFSKFWLDKVIYFLVGLSAIFLLFSWKKMFCKSKKM